MNKIWALPDISQKTISALAQELHVPPAIASVFLVRGIHNLDSLREFNELSLQSLHDPFLLPDMNCAVERICRAMKHNEQIMVIGDADCDGITATVLMVSALRSFGVDYNYLIPNRLTDGFGLKTSHIEFAKENNASLIITVDCGSEAFDAAQRAKVLGVDLIITDHHAIQPEGLPHAVACINPQRSDSVYPSGLTGVGVALKLILGITERIGGNTSAVVEHFSDLVALGTVADVAPMIGENRSLVSAGCNRLTHNEQAGIRELLKAAKIQQVDSTAIGYFLAPMINGACRLGQPELAVRLLLENNPVEAKILAKKLHDLNIERKLLQQITTEEALQTLPDEPNSVVTAVGNWHPGVIGLVAGRFVQRYCRPSIVFSVRGNGTARGSCRSIPGFDILSALQEAGRDLPIKCGGHVLAAGMDIPEEHLPTLIERLNEYAALQNVQTPDMLEIDARLPFSEIDPRTHNLISNLAPFGTGNPEPMFLTENLMLLESKTFGNDKHLRLTLGNLKSHRFVSAIGWNMAQFEQYPIQSMVDVVFRLNQEGYTKNKTLVLTIEDIRQSPS